MPSKNAFGTPECTGVLLRRLESLKLPVSMWTAAEDANFDLDCLYIRFCCLTNTSEAQGVLIVKRAMLTQASRPFH